MAELVLHHLSHVPICHNPVPPSAVKGLSAFLWSIPNSTLDKTKCSFLSVIFPFAIGFTGCGFESVGKTAFAWASNSMFAPNYCSFAERKSAAHEERSSSFGCEAHTMFWWQSWATLTTCRNRWVTTKWAQYLTPNFSKIEQKYWASPAPDITVRLRLHVVYPTC